MAENLEKSVIREESKIDEILSLNRFEKVTLGIGLFSSLLGISEMATDIYNSLMSKNYNLGNIGEFGTAIGLSSMIICLTSYFRRIYKGQKL